MSVDSAGNLFFAVGNGSFNALNNSGGTEYGDTFIRLSTSQNLAVADYFTPFNEAFLAANDLDVGSGGTPVTISKVSRFGPVVLCEQTKPEETLVSDPLPKEHRAALLQRVPGDVLLIGDPDRRRVVLYRVREVYVPKLD